MKIIKGIIAVEKFWFVYESHKDKAKIKETVSKIKVDDITISIYRLISYALIIGSFVEYLMSQNCWMHSIIAESTIANPESNQQVIITIFVFGVIFYIESERLKLIKYIQDYKKEC